MEEAKKNKRQTPLSPGTATSPHLAAQNGGMGVRVRFRMGRGAEGVAVDDKNEAVVDAGLAAYLISIGYADEVK